jgi:tetratricopeptide (TPR) repeat protein
LATAAARRSFQAAMDLRESLGDRRGVSVAMNNMALLELDDGDLARARELFEQTLVIKRQLGEQRSLAIGLANLADILIRTGQWDAARRALDEGTELATGIGNPQLIGTLRCNQGNLAARQQHWAEAAGHYQAAVDAYREAGHPHDTVEALIGLGSAGSARAPTRCGTCGTPRRWPTRSRTRSGWRRSGPRSRRSARPRPARRFRAVSGSCPACGSGGRTTGRER